MRLYVATHLRKEACMFEPDGGGLVGDWSVVADHAVNVESEDAGGLLKGIERHLCLDPEDVKCLFTGDEDDVSEIRFNRIETVDGHKPSPLDMDSHRKGKLDLYQADYYVRVEVRDSFPVPFRELKAVPGRSVYV